MESIVYGVFLIAIVMLLYLSIGDYRKKSSSNTAKVSTTGTKIKVPDKRVAKRVEVKWPVTIETGEGPINGETVNVSISGAFICCQKPLSAKETFRLTMTPPHHQAITATVKVMWSNANVQESEILNRGMGVCFLGISNEDRQFISEIAADHHPKGQEKREAIRAEVKWPVTIETGEGTINGETVNVNISGAFICCQKPLSAKETFRLTMTPPHHQAITATAEVVWSNANVPESEIINRGMGVRFLEISNENRQFITEAVADHHH